MFAYKRHGVSYVARPPASIRPRKGLFKKASNLNYGLNVAIRVEEIMAESGGQVTDPVEVRLLLLWVVLCSAAAVVLVVRATMKSSLQ